MAAKLQAMGYEAYFYEPAAGGHGYGKDNRERACFTALGYNFMRRAIGWDATAEATAARLPPNTPPQRLTKLQQRRRGRRIPPTLLASRRPKERRLAACRA
jgi:hypothetical protein